MSTLSGSTITPEPAASLAPQPATLPAGSGVRASDAERRATIERLKQASVEGRITLDELGQRITLVHAARTRDELAQLTIDLPDDPAAPATRPLAPRAVSRPPVLSTVAVMGSSERTGAWRVAESSHVISVMGSCKLDLRQAALTAPVTTVQAWIVMGSLDVIVPPGMVVEMDAVAVMGSKSVKVAVAPPPAGAPVLRISGVVLMGSVTVKDKLSVAERLGEALRG